MKPSLQQDQWYIVDDEVMGGKSSGYVRDKGHNLLFEGTISLENNGGFSSIRTKIADESAHLVRQIRLLVEGDGRDYELLFKQNGERVAYRHQFKTTAGKKSDLHLSVAEFKPTFRGKPLEKKVPSAAKIKELGFMQADGQSGEFRLIIHHVLLEA
ncbi:MAG: CIA30 family protein [Fulvivirga sp.]|nr:CIA30 family protein [Fulvivirga sp.]